MPYRTYWNIQAEREIHTSYKEQQQEKENRGGEIEGKKRRWHERKKKKKKRKKEKERKGQREKKGRGKKKTSPSKLSVHKLLTCSLGNSPRTSAASTGAKPPCTLFFLSFPRTSHHNSCCSEHPHAAPFCHYLLLEWPAKQVSFLSGHAPFTPQLNLLTSSCSWWYLWDADSLHSHFEKKPAGAAISQ